VRYYLANDTVDVTEPKQLNSGLPQVCAARRGMHARAGPRAALALAWCPTLAPCFASARLLAQGALLKRHSATLAGGAPLRPADLALGAPVALYGRAFQLVDADSFTRAWLAARGAPAGDALPYPEGAIEARARRRREAAAGAGAPAADPRFEPGGRAEPCAVVA